MKARFYIAAVLFLILAGCSDPGADIYLTLIPPDMATSLVPLDIRAGISNSTQAEKSIELVFYLDGNSGKKIIHRSFIKLSPGSTQCIKFKMTTKGLEGKNRVILVAREGRKKQKAEKEILILGSETRSCQIIDGTWVGLYHWSETEAKDWNPEIKELTDPQWKELVRSMHKTGMNIIVIQETFRNQKYAGEKEDNPAGYSGKAFYPSSLYESRMPVKASDPVEDILAEADSLGMNVFLGVGMYAWFDFSRNSLEWHKKIAKELWDIYGHHQSFYGFYVSEESGGSLDNWEKDEQMRKKRQEDIVSFFSEFKAWCNSFAPSKPIMLATNSMGITSAKDVYPEVLKNVDILCPFGFSRMPPGDITGEQAAVMLQRFCDKAGAHLWLDLETFLFAGDGSLYPRPVEQIEDDLTIYSNFEKTICYQFPGLFSDPDNSFRLGGPQAVKLFRDYRQYYESRLKVITAL